MANRTTVKSNIVSKNVPSVTNTILTDMLNADMNDNIVFKEDVAVVQSSSTSNITCDFTGKDRINLTRTGGSLNITLSGIGDGQTVHLLITKTTGQAITWVGVTDVTPVVADVTALSTVLYEVVRKGSNYYARAFVVIGAATELRAGILETATQSEANSLTVTDKIITPGTIPKGSTTQEGVVEIATSSEINAGTDVDGTGDQLVVQPSELLRIGKDTGASWSTLTKEASWDAGTVQYYLDNRGFVHVRCTGLNEISIDITTFREIGTLPSGYRPYQNTLFSVCSALLTNPPLVAFHHTLAVETDGTITITAKPDAIYIGHSINFEIMFKTT